MALLVGGWVRVSISVSMYEYVCACTFMYHRLCGHNLTSKCKKVSWYLIGDITTAENSTTNAKDPNKVMKNSRNKDC